MRDLQNGTKMDIRFATQDMVERARVEEEFQFLFANGDEFTFMNKETFDQIIVNRELIGDPAAFLADGMTVKAQMNEGKPLSIALPENVIMLITKTSFRS